MLQEIRDKAHGWWTWVLVPVLILLFALWGVSNYLGGSMANDAVAKVNGSNISVSYFSMIYQSVNRSNNANQNEQTSALLKKQVLQDLINKILLEQALEKLGLSVDNNTISEAIYSIPAFQENGAFSRERYSQVLQSVGQTTESLKSNIRQTYLVNQFQTGLHSSEFAIESEIIRETHYAHLKREVSMVNVPFSQFMPHVAPTSAEIQAYYITHQEDYKTQDQVKLQYLILSQKGSSAAYQDALSQLANLSFQYAGSLAIVAKKMQLHLETTPMLSTGKPSSILKNPLVLQAVMTDSVLKQGNNSSVLNIGPDKAIVVRVIDHKPSRIIPLIEVQAQVKQAILLEKEKTAAQLVANSMVTALNKGGRLSSLARENNFVLETLHEKTLTSNIQKLSEGQATAISSAQGIQVVQVTKIRPNLDAEALSVVEVQNMWFDIEASQFLLMLQKKASIKINPSFSK